MFPDAIPTLCAGIVGSGFRSRSTTCWRRRCVHVKLPARLAHGRTAAMLTWANACSAFAVSRLRARRRSRLDRAAILPEIRQQAPRAAADADLNHIHWSTTRRDRWPTLMAFCRPSRATGGAGRQGQRIPRPHQRVQSAGGSGGDQGGGWARASCCSTGPMAERCSAPPITIFWISRPVSSRARTLRFEAKTSARTSPNGR